MKFLQNRVLLAVLLLLLTSVATVCGCVNFLLPEQFEDAKKEENAKNGKANGEAEEAEANGEAPAKDMPMNGNGDNLLGMPQDAPMEAPVEAEPAGEIEGFCGGAYAGF